MSVFRESIGRSERWCGVSDVVSRIRKVDGDFNTFLTECTALAEHLAPNPELKTHDYERMKILIAIAVEWIAYEQHGK
jgi:hypothetical protein